MLKPLLAAALLSLWSVSVSASPIIINAADYPVGTDLSNIYSGVTLSTITNRPNHDGENGRTAYEPIFTPVLASLSYHITGEISFGRFDQSRDYRDCAARGDIGSDGCRAGWTILEMVFDTPTDYVSISSSYWSDGPGFFAFDSDGHQIADITTVLGQTPVGNSYHGQQVLQRNQRDIARIIYGGSAGVTSANQIAFEDYSEGDPIHAPVPATLLVTLIGLPLLYRRRI